MYSKSSHIKNSGESEVTNISFLEQKPNKSYKLNSESGSGTKELGVFNKSKHL